MSESQRSRCSFMIGSEVISLSPSKKSNDQADQNHGGLFQIGAGVQLNQADSAWLAEILFTRRRHLSTPVFSAASHRRYSASKRRVLRRSLPTITEQDSPLFDDEGYDDDDGCFNGSCGSCSEPGSPSLSASSSGSSSGGSDEDEFVQKWNKLASNSHHHRSQHSNAGHKQPLMQSLSSPLPESTPSSYYELFGDENDGSRHHSIDRQQSVGSNSSDDSNDDDLFTDDLTRRLEIEAAAKRKDTHQRYQMGVIGQVARFAL